MNNGKLISILILVLATTAARAHGTHPVGAEGFLGGLWHPFSGLDHWLVAIMLGVWAGRAWTRRAGISTVERGLLLLSAVAYGTAHGMVLATASGGLAFCMGFSVSTLALIGIGAAACSMSGYRAVRCEE